MNYFSFGFVHFNTVEQKDKFFNFARNKEFIGPSEKCCNASITHFLQKYRTVFEFS